ncbi:MAG: hypothetical protein V3U35_09315, partial [Candidatus Neomarinimicrobiota bacterium]
LQFSAEPFLNLGAVELDELRLVYNKVNDLKSDGDILRIAMKSLGQLDTVPKSSPLRFLGYVSILESIITHHPAPKDPYDSLTRQVAQKMLLVGHRSIIPIPYELFGSQVNRKKLWNQLYDYRSKIAHGAAPEFNGRFQRLKDFPTVLEFISSATVAVMRQALEEPKLIADLREC